MTDLTAPEPRQVERLTLALVLVISWLAAVLLLSTVLMAQEGLSFQWSFLTSAVYFSILVALVAPVRLLLRKLRFGRGIGPTLLRLALHVCLGLVIVPTWVALYEGFMWLQGGPELLELYRESSGYWQWLQSALAYGLLMAALEVIQIARRLRAEERSASKLLLLMREAELRALRAQLRPHFLFNTLNSIYSLISSHPERAETMVVLLADLMRDTLELSDQPWVTVGDELALVQRYLAIEAVRLGDRLIVEVEATCQARSARIPPLLLQPIVENSVRHGIAPQVESGIIQVRAHCTSERLVINLSDTGQGFSSAGCSTSGGGRGLAIVRSRLENTYEGDFLFDVEPAEPKGTNITISIPLRLVRTDSNALGALDL